MASLLDRLLRICVALLPTAPRTLLLVLPNSKVYEWHLVTFLPAKKRQFRGR